MDPEQITEALAAIKANSESMQQTKRDELRGEPGPRGLAGLPGRDGRDAVNPKIRIGVVKSGEQAGAVLTEVGNGEATFVLDLVLPFAERGARGETGPAGVGIKGDPGKDAPIPKIQIGQVSSGDHARASVRNLGEGLFELNLILPKGETGKSGRDGQSPSREEVTEIVESVLTNDSFRGEKGEAGRDGLSEENIREIVRDVVIETMSNAGVLNQNAEKLIRIRTKLKQSIHEVDARHQYQLGTLIREIDKLF